MVIFCSNKPFICVANAQAALFILPLSVRSFRFGKVGERKGMDGGRKRGREGERERGKEVEEERERGRERQKQVR